MQYWSIRCSWSIACRRCSNCIFILDLTPGFNGLDKDNCKTRREAFHFFGFGASYIRSFMVICVLCFRLQHGVYGVVGTAQWVCHARFPVQSLRHGYGGPHGGTTLPGAPVRGQRASPGHDWHQWLTAVQGGNAGRWWPRPNMGTSGNFDLRVYDGGRSCPLSLHYRGVTTVVCGYCAVDIIHSGEREVCKTLWVHRWASGEGTARGAWKEETQQVCGLQEDDSVCDIFLGGCVYGCHRAVMVGVYGWVCSEISQLDEWAGGAGTVRVLVCPVCRAPPHHPAGQAGGALTAVRGLQSVSTDQCYSHGRYDGHEPYRPHGHQWLYGGLRCPSHGGRGQLGVRGPASDRPQLLHLLRRK